MKHRYGEMTWWEVRDAARAGRVAVLPVATHEDHGPHLPVDTDVVLCAGICDRAAARVPELAVVAPTVGHGYSPHHMDFHGTLTIGWDTFVRYVKDVCCSLAHHGFERILVVNGHGSNASPLDLAARLTILEYEGRILCASVSYWDLRRVKEVGRQVRESAYGGTSHAGEFETSLYLALRPELVDMSRAVDERTPMSPSFRSDLLAGTHPEGSAARLVPYWSSVTGSGVMGEATRATPEKGQRFLEAAVAGLVELIRELRSQPVLPRRDQH
ncbi:MAG: creatininase family protein [Gemmatimonadota bacterium]